jgi:type VI secretion system protein ImpG
LPNELRVGDVSVATPRSPTVAPFRNITPVTRAIRPAVGAELSWRFVAHTALNRSSLSDPAALRALLALYNFHETVDVQLGRANRLRVEAIRDVKMAPARRLLDHVAVRGTKTAIEVDETSFASIGDVYLFGCALDALFAAQTPVNSFHELAMTAHPSGTPFAWKPRTGLEQIY